ncbi:tryptophan dimethylallyltransferase family protein [Saccharothrix sp.]|uniref:tryptophan dimethylallyltransferase family protein n=1 Tax=Saccharothrix sp. TaxID=1873460 RepID=UPI002810D56C|nr:tryptophan dimethylallyltransferase family protein [Saccharothrix sp.]
MGIGDNIADCVSLLADALGPGALRSISDPIRWASGVADDHSPVEFSTAFGIGERPVVRMIVEPTANTPSRQDNTAAALRALRRMARRADVDTSRFDAVADLFLPEHPEQDFVFWYSLVLQHATPPAVKVYLNPEVRGGAAADGLVHEALSRTGFGAGHAALRAHALTRPGLDRYSFFALDLVERRRARVKVYVSHDLAGVADVTRAAQAATGVDSDRLPDFCLLTGGREHPTFGGRPLVSSFTFMDGDDTAPSGYSLYVPIRDYVNDDAEARARVLAVMAKYGLDATQFDRALDSIAQRPLDEGVGLIAHVSLRMGRPRPGISVYLSSEAYSTTAPRSATSVAV